MNNIAGVNKIEISLKIIVLLLIIPVFYESGPYTALMFLIFFLIAFFNNYVLKEFIQDACESIDEVARYVSLPGFENDETENDPIVLISVNCERCGHWASTGAIMCVDCGHEFKRHEL